MPRAGEISRARTDAGRRRAHGGAASYDVGASARSDPPPPQRNASTCHRISLDSDVNRWKAAIEQDQLAWPNHVSDLAGWRNAAAREYGISSIPHTMLIDRDGSILATHLRGGGVESALRGIFEK